MSFARTPSTPTLTCRMSATSKRTQTMISKSAWTSVEAKSSLAALMPVAEGSPGFVRLVRYCVPTLFCTSVERASILLLRHDLEHARADAGDDPARGVRHLDLVEVHDE